jgi:hypothetical protein
VPGSPNANDTLITLTTKFYDGMAERADDRVFTGYPTKLFDELSIPISYYSRIKQQLEALGYAEQVEQGRGGRPSVWRLWKRPHPDSWKILYERGLTRPPSSGTLTDVSNRVEAIERRLGGLNVVQAIAELQQEIHEARRVLNGLIATTTQ